MISVLFTAGLCALTHFAVAQELRLDDVVTQEERVQVMHLPNGVKTYIRENQFPSQSCSLRVVLRKSSGGEERFSFDGALNSQDNIEQFLALCRKKLLGEVIVERGNDFFCCDPSLFHMDHPQEVAVIAVGDFIAENMQGLIDKHFGDIILNDDVDSATSIQIGQDEKISKGILRLFYPTFRKSIATYRDLKESWNSLLLQELFQQRLERCSRDLDEAWVHPHRRFFYPVNGYAFVSVESMENLLSFFLWQAEAARNDGFFEEEFYVVKNKLIDQLQYLSLNATDPDHAFLASYYADQFLLGDQCLNCQDFLTASAHFVEEIQSEDIFSCLDSFFHDDHRQIRVMYPMSMHSNLLTRVQVEELIDQVASLASFYRNSEIPEDSEWTFDNDEIDYSPINSKEMPFQNFEFAKCIHEDRAPLRLASDARVALVNSENPAESFFSLPLSEKEKRFIKSIISTMAEKNLVQLVFEKYTIEKKGNKIKHVHPLRFMGYILSHSDLRSDVRTIKKSSFKWDAFVDGFAKRMKEELSHGNVYQHIPGFAMEVGSTPEHIADYVHKRDFEGLIRSLL